MKKEKEKKEFNQINQKKKDNERVRFIYFYFLKYSL